MRRQIKWLILLTQAADAEPRSARPRSRAAQFRTIRGAVTSAIVAGARDTGVVFEAHDGKKWQNCKKKKKWEKFARLTAKDKESYSEDRLRSGSKHFARQWFGASGWWRVPLEPHKAWWFFSVSNSQKNWSELFPAQLSSCETVFVWSDYPRLRVAHCRLLKLKLTFIVLQHRWIRKKVWCVPRLWADVTWGTWGKIFFRRLRTYWDCPRRKTEKRSNSKSILDCFISKVTKWTAMN